MNDVKIREYIPSDFEAIRDLHFKVYPKAKLPNIDSPYFFPFKKVMLVDDRIILAALGSQEIEGHFLVDPDWGDPLQKFCALRAIQNEALRSVRDRGFETCFSTIHEDLEKSYGKRLTELGWFKPPKWSFWLRSTTEV